MVNRIVVGAHYGLRGWLFQRMTAVVMLAYIVLFAIVVAASPALDHATWRALFTPQWMKLATLLFLLSVYLHAWIGVRDIVMDYVKPVWVKMTLYTSFVCALVAYAAWSARILWGF